MTIRPVIDRDWASVGELGELLVEMHHNFDRRRFVQPDVLRADAYIARVREELSHGRATLLVAEQDGRVAGYVFAGIEPQSWKELRYEAGFIHDIIVDNRHRQSGIGEALIAGAIEWFTARRVTRVMLWSAYDNTGAQRLFRRAGFRPTMMEMTLDL